MGNPAAGIRIAPSLHARSAAPAPMSLAAASVVWRSPLRGGARWSGRVGSLFRRVPLAAAGLGSGVLRRRAPGRLRLPGRGGSVRGGVGLVEVHY